MKRSRILSSRLPVILASIVLVLSVAVYGLRWGLGGKVAPGKYAGPDPVALPESTGVSEALPAAAKWPAPERQSRGPLWSFGLFTPPEIHFDRQHGAFAIIPPAVLPELTPAMTAADAELGLVLHAVRREAYPLQLVGYMGDESDLLGTFANTNTGETLVRRAGARIDSPAVVVEQLGLAREEEQLPESMNIRVTKISAVVREIATGQRLALQQGAIAYSGRLQAVVAVAAEPTPRICLEGDIIDAGENRYRIEKIRLAPPAVDVTKEGAGEPDSNRHTLTPVFAPQTPR